MKPLLIILLCLTGYGVIGQNPKNIKVGKFGLLLDTTSAFGEFQRSRSDGSMTIFEGKKADTCYCPDMAANVTYYRSLEGIKKPIVFAPPVIQDSIAFKYDTIPVIILFIDTNTITFHWSTGEIVKDNQVVHWMKGYEVMTQFQRLHVSYLDEKKSPIYKNITVLFTK